LLGRGLDPAQVKAYRYPTLKYFHNELGLEVAKEKEVKKDKDNGLSL